MELRSIGVIVFLWAAPLWAQDQVSEEETLDSWSESELAESLNFTQKEQQARFDSGVALNLGTVMPWSELGLSFLWQEKPAIDSLSLGAGNFEFSDTYRERNYIVKFDSQSVYYASRFFPLAFGPLYIEPMVGIVHWEGSLFPRGSDPLTDELASALTAKFIATGASLGVNFGLMWIFSNLVFIDYNLFGLSYGQFISQRYSTSATEARANVRRQLQGPLSTSNAQIRIGWSWLL